MMIIALLSVGGVATFTVSVRIWLVVWLNVHDLNVLVKLMEHFGGTKCAGLIRDDT